MSSIIKVPNIGDFKEVEIIEVLVKNGDNINKGDPVITLESDKSSVEVPSTFVDCIDMVERPKAQDYWTPVHPKVISTDRFGQIEIQHG